MGKFSDPRRDYDALKIRQRKPANQPLKSNLFADPTATHYQLRTASQDRPKIINFGVLAQRPRAAIEADSYDKAIPTKPTKP